MSSPDFSILPLAVCNKRFMIDDGARLLLGRFGLVPVRQSEYSQQKFRANQNSSIRRGLETSSRNRLFPVAAHRRGRIDTPSSDGLSFCHSPLLCPNGSFLLVGGWFGVKSKKSPSPVGGKQNVPYSWGKPKIPN